MCGRQLFSGLSVQHWTVTLIHGSTVPHSLPSGKHTWPSSQVKPPMSQQSISGIVVQISTESFLGSGAQHAPVVSDTGGSP
jgi:hypothetical protein